MATLLQAITFREWASKSLARLYQKRLTRFWAPPDILHVEVISGLQSSARYARMQFKAPKGDIRWWSILWLVLGLFLTIISPFQGNFAYAILGSILVAIVALVWLDQRWIAPPLMIFQLLGAIARVVMLFSTGITFAGIIKVATPVYFAYIFWEWYRSEQETIQVELGLPRSPTSPFDRPPADDHFSNPYRGSHQDER